jgi:hypothetical protein
VLTPILASVTSVYDRAIVDTGRQPEFLFFVAFLVTFGFIRTSAHMIRAQVSWWPGNVQVGGTHIHHLVWGIVLLLITGYVGVAIRPPSPWQEFVAIFFGIGTGLTLDEFALWLDLKDVYWAQDGRKSIDAVIVAATTSGMVLIGFSAWIDVATQVEDAIFALVGAFGFTGIVAAVVNLAKEKFGVAIVGFLIPPIGIAAAFRLGRPRSLWARLFYDERKLHRAEERFANGRRLPWRRHKDDAASGQSARGSPEGVR